MSSSTSSLYLLVRVAMSLGLVLGMVGIAVWALRRRGAMHARGAAVRRLEVVDRRALSKGAHVAVVRLGDEDYLIGVTEQRVELLGTTPVAAAAATATVAPTATIADGDDVVVQLPAIGQSDASSGTAVSAASSQNHRLALVSTRKSGAAEAGASRRTGHARPARCAEQETRMGFVEALRELTVRRS
jgi:flagellar biosynthetic protein FliO